MADMITIDASNLGSFNYSSYITEYFASLGSTAGSSTWYPGHTNAAQVGFRYSADQTSAQVVLNGDLSYSSGVSGSVTGFTLGHYTDQTTTDESGALTGVDAGLVVSGLDLTQATASTDVATNKLYALYRALQRGNVAGDRDLNGDGAVSATENVDYIYSVLSAHAQHFIGSAGVDEYTGTTYADHIEGNDGDDILSGGEGNDTIDGGAGVDAMTGGLGDDSYVVDNAGDVVTENADGGDDTITTTLNHYQIAANVEKLVLSGALAVYGYGNDVSNTIEGSDIANAIYALGGDDTVSGGAGNDTIDGGAGADAINGGDGADILNGGLGADSMAGGLGDDSYVVDNLQDVVTEDADGGADTITSTVSHYQIAANVEKLVLSGSLAVYGYGNDSGNTIEGSDIANAIYALGGNDTVTGGAGNDTIDGGAGADAIDGGDGADTLKGGDGADTLTGGAGDDILNGGLGADGMAGGLGDDSYVVDDLKDVVTEASKGGTDTITTTVSHYQIAANVEKLVLSGSLAVYGYGNDSGNTIEGSDIANAIYAMGGNDTVTGGAGNDTIDGGAGADVIDGGDGADMLKGGDGADTLKGGDGNDILNGGAGADTMVGGLGNDSYVVDDLKDVVTEASKGGTDTITTTVNHYQIAANVEKLVLSGALAVYGYGNDAANTIEGSDIANTIYAMGGNDTVSGGAGNDVIDGGAGADVLDGGTGADKLAGGEGNDTLKGGDGNDTLNGGVGSDTLIGGLGNDSYVVDSLKDVVTEAAKGGTDTVTATVNKYHLAANVEKLVLSGSTAVYGYGNDAGNTITGSSIGNLLYGEAGADTISGGAGNDTLSGGADADSLSGGSGNDKLSGGSANDKLTGGSGMDVMTGGSGADTFVFALGDSAASRSKADTITDFNGKQGDIIDLSSIDANENKKGNQAFSFIGDDAFSHHAGELRAYVAGGEHYIAGDTDGDGKADFTIHFDNDVTFKAAYFDL